MKNYLLKIVFFLNIINLFIFCCFDVTAMLTRKHTNMYPKLCTYNEHVEELQILLAYYTSTIFIFETIFKYMTLDAMVKEKTVFVVIASIIIINNNDYLAGKYYTRYSRK